MLFFTIIINLFLRQILFINTSVFFDAAVDKQSTFQTPATYIMDNIIDLHHDIFSIMIIIATVVIYILFIIIVKYKSTNFKTSRVFYFTHNTILEIIWTVVPMLILIIILIPSFSLLYGMDTIRDAQVTSKVIGRQWYWTYESTMPFVFYKKKYASSFFESIEKIKSKEFLNWDYLIIENKNWKIVTYDLLELIHRFISYVGQDNRVFVNTNFDLERYYDFLLTFENDFIVFKNINFDAYALPIDELPLGSFRLLEVDNIVMLPINIDTRVLVTSSDVLHSWALPSFGIKIDACPGRLNQVWINPYRFGTFYGQCSELCGINHGFMPIVIEIKTYTKFLKLFKV